jgi:DNA-binding NtrC family response regulator
VPDRRGRETILVVEDEPAVRHFLESVLARRGYATRAVESPADALALLESGWKPDLLLTDFVLPGGMNGADLALAATRLDPALRVILMSGYSNQPVAVGGALPARAFLEKPFTPDVLCAAIRDVLGGG